MFYKIGQVAKIFGLSPNTLRHYEKLGMIHPQVDPETNFRYYEPKDIVWLLLCKGFYSMGFSIKETVELAYHMDYQKALDCLSSRRDSLHQELEALTACCQRMDRVCQNWESSRAMVGRCQVTFRPAYWKLDLFNGRDAFSSGESSRLVQQWLDHMPHVRAVCSFPLSCLRHPDTGTGQWGIGVLQAMAERLGIPDTHIVRHLPSSTCVTTAFYADINRPVRVRDFSYALDYISRHKYRVCGEALGYTNSLDLVNGVSMRCIALSIPVKD